MSEVLLLWRSARKKTTNKHKQTPQGCTRWDGETQQANKSWEGQRKMGGKDRQVRRRNPWVKNFKPLQHTTMGINMEKTVNTEWQMLQCNKPYTVLSILFNTPVSMCLLQPNPVTLIDKVRDTSVRRLTIATIKMYSTIGLIHTANMHWLQKFLSVINFSAFTNYTSFQKNSPFRDQSLNRQWLPERYTSIVDVLWWLLLNGT